ncbi:hypothetical protein LJB42_004307 [Komagataella kurtzmanii]|nr:hypothetical protein LJB42_004307 [Komagataella kurtzmanii]
MVKEQGLYNLLGISPSASDAEIKKAYRKMALKYHPDKPTGDTEKFKEISEAFDILSDSDKREVYDQYGLEAARGNAPAGGNPFAGAGGPGGAGGQTFGFGGSGGGHTFSQADAFNIFEQFGGFGGLGGMGGGMGGMGGGRGGSPFGGGGASYMKMPGGFGGESPSSYGSQVEPEVVTLKLNCTLEELFNGATKKMKLNRKGANGVKEEKILCIDLKPGWKSGTKINFTNEGDYQPEARTRQTIQFIIAEKPNDTFRRDGDDLHYTIPLTFKESLLGFDKEIKTIDGKRIHVSKSQPIQPTQTINYPGLGMPISKKPGQRGDLIVHYKVDYPISLTGDQRDAISKAF